MDFYQMLLDSPTLRVRRIAMVERNIATTKKRIEEYEAKNNPLWYNFIREMKDSVKRWENEIRCIQEMQ